MENNQEQVTTALDKITAFVSQGSYNLESKTIVKSLERIAGARREAEGRGDQQAVVAANTLPSRARSGIMEMYYIRNSRKDASPWQSYIAVS